MTQARVLLIFSLVSAGAVVVLLNLPIVAFLKNLMGPLLNFETGIPLVVVLIAIVVTGFVVVLASKSRRRPVEQISIKDIANPETVTGQPAPSSVQAAQQPRHEADESKKLIEFAHELLGATTSERLREVIVRHVPPLVGSRRVWISSRIQGLRQVIVAEGRQGGGRGLFDTSEQEWTTFPLRVDQNVVGLLGVESGGGLDSHLIQLVRIAAPLIAQALNTADRMETLREASLVDLLTGAATRREGLTRLRAEVKRAQRTSGSMAVLMLDLDRFKSINDQFGHAVGDAVLTAVGRTLQKTLRASDTRCRWGGEEFLIALPDTDLTRAQVVANGLLKNIAAATVATPAGPVGSTVSIGITITRPGETQIEGILRRADIALYRAKEAGRSCVRIVLGDRTGNPIGLGSQEEPKPPPPARSNTLPFPDRRNPQRGDRRNVPSPGRRSTDLPPQSSDQPSAIADDRRGQNSHH